MDAVVPLAAKRDNCENFNPPLDKLPADRPGRLAETAIFSPRKYFIRQIFIDETARAFDADTLCSVLMDCVFGPGTAIGAMMEKAPYDTCPV